MSKLFGSESGNSERKAGYESESDNSCSMFRDTRQSWLAKFWGSEKHQGTKRVNLNRSCQYRSKGRGRVRNHDKGLYNRPSISSVSLVGFVQSMNHQADCYSVSLHGPYGLGISLFVSFDGVVTVEGLHPLRNGTSSPGQNCEVIKVGDQLVQVNNINLEALSFYSTTELLKDLDKLAKDNPVLLTLRYGDTFPALPPESMTGESTDDEAGDSDSDSSSHPLDLIPCHAQRNFSPHCKRVNSENSFFIDKSLLVEPSHHPPQMSMESGIRSAKVSFVEKPAEKATIRDNRAHASAKEDDFLSMFEDDAFAPLSNDIDLSALGGVFRSFSMLARKPHHTESLTQISEVELYQHHLRNIHLYSTAARVTTIASVSHEKRILDELANEIFEWRPWHLNRLYAGYYQSGEFPALIASPEDTARYTHTEHLDWDATQRSFVVRTQPTQVPPTVLDHQLALQVVLLRLEMEIRMRNQPLSDTMRVDDDVWRDLPDASEQNNADGDGEIEGFYNTLRSRSNTADSAQETPDFPSSRTHEDPPENESPYLVPPKQKFTKGAAKSIVVRTADNRTSIVVHGSQTASAQAAANTGSVAAPTRKDSQQVEVVAVGYTLPSERVARPAYYTKKYDHLISRDHASVQRLLTASSSEGTISQLSLLVEAEIENITELQEGSNPYHNARHFETHEEVSVPPILLTYQIFYVMVHLKAILLTEAELINILEKWATTFNPRDIVAAKAAHAAQQSLSSANGGKSSSFTHHSRKSFPFSGPDTDSSRHSLDHSGGVSKKQFNVYFHGDVQTVRNLYNFVEVASELLTLLVLHRVAPDCLAVRQATLAASAEMSGIGAVWAPSVSTSAIPLQTTLKYLPVALSGERGRSVTAVSASAATAASADRTRTLNDRGMEVKPEWNPDDALASAYVKKFGGLLKLDMIALAALVVQYPQTLSAVLETASHDAVFHAACESVLSFLRQTRGGITSAAQFFEKVNGLTNSDPQPYPLFLCVSLRTLDCIMEHNQHLALDLTCTLYPHLSPWMVRRIMYARINTQAYTPIINANVDPAFIHAQCMYYTYLTRLMRGQSNVSTSRPDLVLQWFEIALFLAQHDAVSALDYREGKDAFCTPHGKKKSPYVITLRNILHHAEQYSLPNLAALRLCAEYGFEDGVREFARRLLLNCLRVADSHMVPFSQGIDEAAIGFFAGVDASVSAVRELSDVLGESMRRALLQLAVLISQQQAGAAASTTVCSQDQNETAAAEVELAQIFDSLSSLLTMLYQAHSVLESTNPYSQDPQQHRNRSVEVAFGALLQTILLSCVGANEQVDALPTSALKGVTNVVCEVLLHSLGVDSATTVLKNTPFLLLNM